MSLSQIGKSEHASGPNNPHNYHTQYMKMLKTTGLVSSKTPELLSVYLAVESPYDTFVLPTSNKIKKISTTITQQPELHS